MDRLARARRRATALDARLLRRAMDAGDQGTDATLRSLSRAANRSKVWIGSAAVLSVAGGSKGRRAALRGLLGIAITSSVVNGPLKLILRRERPTAHLLGRPALVVMPSSFSFPSGHAASAFAFATSVAREWPSAGAPVAALAGAVAYSRVHTGVHYPSDVVVGAGLGIGAAAIAGAMLRDEPGIQLPRQTTCRSRRRRGYSPARAPDRQICMRARRRHSSRPASRWSARSTSPTRSSWPKSSRCLPQTVPSSWRRAATARSVRRPTNWPAPARCSRSCRWARPTTSHVRSASPPTPSRRPDRCAPEWSARSTPVRSSSLASARTTSSMPRRWASTSTSRRSPPARRSAAGSGDSPTRSQACGRCARADRSNAS